MAKNIPRVTPQKNQIKCNFVFAVSHSLSAIFFLHSLPPRIYWFFFMGCMLRQQKHIQAEKLLKQNFTNSRFFKYTLQIKHSLTNPSRDPGKNFLILGFLFGLLVYKEAYILLAGTEHGNFRMDWTTTSTETFTRNGFLQVLQFLDFQNSRFRFHAAAEYI